LLAAYNRVDIALDPFPYGGGVTTVEALWMGVPVVTMRGRRWVDRAGASILATAGLPELIADDQEGYLQRVVALAENPRQLLELSSRLRPMLEGSPLYDGPGFTRTVESLLRDMWRAWCRKEGP
jgi:predicted O-linked N-acetylglucosamine transferase (SPINDLY family)